MQLGFPSRSIPRADLPRLTRDTDERRKELLRFGRDSDEEFTALARGLGALNRQLADVRELAARFDRIVAGTDEERALEAAEKLYKSTVDLVHSSMGIAVSEHEELAQIEESLLAACGARDAFRRNHLLLRILIMSTRMEASRLDAEYQGVFHNVAAAIEEIDCKITASTEKAFQRIETVIDEAKRERGDLRALERSLEESARTSIAALERELGAVRTALEPCAARSREIADLVAGTEPRTFALLGALQHQDIVRQRLEHVAAGFADLRDHVHAAAAGGRARLDPGYLARAAALQGSQLGAARAEIAEAGAVVGDGLAALLESGGRLIERFTALEQGATTAFRGCRVAALFEAEIRRLADIAGKCKDANDRIARLVARIQEVVEVFSREIANHELDVKIVALNAQVAAARLPAADALNKLAEETSTVSGENAKVTRDLTSRLRANLDKLHHVKVEADTFLGIVSQERVLLEAGVADVSARLARLVETAQSDSIALRTRFEEAHRAVEALVAGFGFPAQIAAAFEPAERLCAAVLARLPADAAHRPLAADAAARFAAHERRYTMIKETTTHAAVLDAAPAARAPVAAAPRFAAAGRPAAPAPAVPPPATAPAPSGDIELF